MSGTADKWVKLGQVLGPWGVKGWIKVYSYTEPRENIVDFPVWSLEQEGQRRSVQLEQGRKHGSHVVAKLASAHVRIEWAEDGGALSGEGKMNMLCPLFVDWLFNGSTC